MEVIGGYRTLHLQEAKDTGIALANMPAEIAVWHRYLTLFDRTMRKEHISPSENQDDARTAWGLRLSLASAAAASAKLTLDAALAGYYFQAFARTAFVSHGNQIRTRSQTASGDSASTTLWC